MNPIASVMALRWQVETTAVRGPLMGFPVRVEPDWVAKARAEEVHMEIHLWDFEGSMEPDRGAWFHDSLAL